MTHPDAWRSIEARIHSIAKAAELNQVFDTNTDNWGRMIYVYTQCVRTFDAIRKFQADYSGNLPKAAEDVLAEFIKGQAPVFGITDPSHRIHIAWHAAVVRWLRRCLAFSPMNKLPSGPEPRSRSPIFKGLLRWMKTTGRFGEKCLMQVRPAVRNRVSSFALAPDFSVQGERRRSKNRLGFS
jgi:hypothetical protein